IVILALWRSILQVRLHSVFYRRMIAGSARIARIARFFFRTTAALNGWRRAIRQTPYLLSGTYADLFSAGLIASRNNGLVPRFGLDTDGFFTRLILRRNGCILH